MPKIDRRAILVAAAVGLYPRSGRAQITDWPTRPVRVVVPYPPGAGTDFLVRAMAERLSRQTGQQFVVEHRGGAAGALGAEAVVKSPHDGYTIMMTPQAPIQLMPHLRKLPYDPMRDFVVVGRMGEAIAGFAVHPSLGVKTIPKFVQLAKARPGKYTFATAGVGSVNHLRGETLKLMAGIDLLHVPYRGVGEALPDLLAGNVDSMFDSTVLAHHKPGRLNVLAIIADERYAELPDVGTMKEQGFPNYDVPLWYGAYAPSGVPLPILERLHREIATIHGDADFHAKQLAGGIQVYREALSLPRLKERVEAQSAMFGDLIRRADIKLDQ